MGGAQRYPSRDGFRKGSTHPTGYANTVDTLRNGITPTARELQNAAKIESLTGVPVILIPKP